MAQTVHRGGASFTTSDPLLLLLCGGQAAASNCDRHQLLMSLGRSMGLAAAALLIAEGFGDSGVPSQHGDDSSAQKVTKQLLNESSDVSMLTVNQVEKVIWEVSRRGGQVLRQFLQRGAAAQRGAAPAWQHAADRGAVSRGGVVPLQQRAAAGAGPAEVGGAVGGVRSAAGGAGLQAFRQCPATAMRLFDRLPNGLPCQGLLESLIALSCSLSDVWQHKLWGPAGAADVLVASDDDDDTSDDSSGSEGAEEEEEVTGEPRGFGRDVDRQQKVRVAAARRLIGHALLTASEALRKLCAAARQQVASAGAGEAAGAAPRGALRVHGGQQRGMMPGPGQQQLPGVCGLSALEVWRLEAWSGAVASKLVECGGGERGGGEQEPAGDVGVGEAVRGCGGGSSDGGGSGDECGDGLAAASFNHALSAALEAAFSDVLMPGAGASSSSGVERGLCPAAAKPPVQVQGRQRDATQTPPAVQTEDGGEIPAASRSAAAAARCAPRSCAGASAAPQLPGRFPGPSSGRQLTSAAMQLPSTARQLPGSFSGASSGGQPLGSFSKASGGAAALQTPALVMTGAQSKQPGAKPAAESCAPVEICNQVCLWWVAAVCLKTCCLTAALRSERFIGNLGKTARNADISEDS